jgi:hypothetical protein
VLGKGSDDGTAGGITQRRPPSLRFVSVHER